MTRATFTIATVAFLCIAAATPQSPVTFEIAQLILSLLCGQQKRQNYARVKYWK